MQLTKLPSLKPAHTVNKRGFTLIEMSIVLVIIGLVIGGILMGNEMIVQAELRKLVSQQERYSSAIAAFRLKYNCIPGDCASASAFGLGTDGDGNGVLGETVFSGSPSCLTDGISCQTTVANAVSRPYFMRYKGEPSAFWVHLSAANLIPEKISQASSFDMSAVMGTYYPSAANNKSYLMAFMWNGKLFMRVGISSTTAWGNPNFWAPTVTGAQMQSMVTKLGYSTIITGYVTGYWPASLAAGQRLVPTGVYPNPGGGNEQRVYYEPEAAATGCISNSSGTYQYVATANCNYLWQLDGL